MKAAPAFESVRAFHDYLKQEGLFRSYEEGRDLSIDLVSWWAADEGSEDPEYTRHQFWVRFVDESCLEFYVDEDFTIRVWDGRLGKIWHEVPGGKSFGMAELQTVLFSIAKTNLYRKDMHFLTHDFDGDSIGLVIRTEIVS